MVAPTKNLAGTLDLYLTTTVRRYHMRGSVPDDGTLLEALAIIAIWPQT